ncbi:MAG: hypothetical protein FWC69_06060 [Defluviitaleaceae bacterium]|nr:hypothetical protein [Defluviitaleaceae bacterium]
MDISIIILAVSTIISAIIPLVILFTTLKHTHKQHEEQLLAQKELNRVSVMPHLIIKREDVKKHLEDFRREYIVNFLAVTFSNKGNGNALDVSLVNLRDDMELSSNLIYKSCIHSSEDARPLNPNDSLISKGEVASFLISQEHPGDNKLLRELEMKRVAEMSYLIKFELRFRDVFLNEYEQKFIMNIRAGAAWSVESHIPKLINRYEGDYLDRDYE